jgi:hypothetical protein
MAFMRRVNLAEHEESAHWRNRPRITADVVLPTAASISCVSQHVETFRCMGCKVRIVIGGPVRTGLPHPAAAAAAARNWLEEYERHVDASPPMRSLVEAGIWAADRSGGLVDPGDITKGFAVDAVGCQLQGYGFYAVDCGGDLRIGGASAQWTRYYVNITNPLTGRTAHLFDASPGAVATSRFEHHTLGLVSATALAPTAIEAEVLARMALLLGAEGARNVLRPWGGVTIDDRGQVERHGPLAHRRVRPQYRTAA